MKNRINILYLIFIILLISCSSSKSDLFNIASISTYTQIPGVTQAEIDAIEELKRVRDSFSYGHLYETEAFVLPDGTYAGFAPEFCKLLSNLFGIDFVFEIYEWDSLMENLNNMTLDFTGDLIPTEERMKKYFMTHLIAERTQKIYMLAENYYNYNVEKDLEGLKAGVLAGSADAEQIKKHYPDLKLSFIEIKDFDSVIEMLEKGLIDVFIIEGVFDPVFNKYDFIRSKDFFPLAYSPVSMTTANPALQPIISVIDKYIASGGIDILFDLYKRGNTEYTRYKLFNSFTKEELEYIEELKQNGKSIKIALESENYPVSFFNYKTKNFEGIAVDVLKEISNLSGIVFETVNNEKTSWQTMLEMLKSNEVSFISELLRTEEREGLFLWPDVPFATWYYALISRYDYPNLRSYQVIRTKVGTLENSVFYNKYHELFPENNNLILFNTADKLFNALEKGQIDLVFGSDHMLLMQQNFYQNPGFKINIGFYPLEYSYFGVNIEEEILCSVICKAMHFIETDAIANSWTSRGYDYVTQMANQRALLYFLITIFMSLMFFLTLYLLFLNKKRLKVVTELNLRKMGEEKAKAESEAKSRFLANMSHEIRSPMNVILGSTQSLLEDESHSKETREILEKIHGSGDLLLKIINDILDLSKIEANKFEIVNEKYDVSSLIYDSINLNNMKYGQKELNFKIKIDENLPVYLFGDELRIKQIVNNLLSNAFKYTASGEVSLSFLRENIENDNNNEIIFVIRVTDTGQGMTAEQVEKLFTEYTRFNIEANRTINGTGLGMAITSNLVKLMNGSISVESTPDKGSNFTIKLPQGVLDDRVLGKENAENLENFRFTGNMNKKTEKIEKSPMPYAKVLIVDDLQINIDVATLVLKPYQMEIDTALSGFEALDIIKSGKVYDIILMDHMMPKMDGIETVKKIRETGYTNAIIALTANAIVGQTQVFKDNGFDGCITKPIDMRELNAVLDEYIRKKH